MELNESLQHKEEQVQDLYSKIEEFMQCQTIEIPIGVMHY